MRQRPHEHRRHYGNRQAEGKRKHVALLFVTVHHPRRRHCGAHGNGGTSKGKDDRGLAAGRRYSRRVKLSYLVVDVDGGQQRRRATERRGPSHPRPKQEQEQEQEKQQQQADAQAAEAEAAAAQAAEAAAKQSCTSVVGDEKPTRKNGPIHPHHTPHNNRAR